MDLRPRRPAVQYPDAPAADAGTVRGRGCGDRCEPRSAGRVTESRVPGARCGGGLAHGHRLCQPHARARDQPGTRRHLQDHRRHAVVSGPHLVAATLASPRAGPGEAHQGARTMSRAWPVIALTVAAALTTNGCGRRSVVVTPGDLPPAYTRDKILDPKLAEVAKTFTAWAGEQKAKTGAAFGAIEVLPPAPTLLPYGVGTYQKQLRLPAILV